MNRLSMVLIVSFMVAILWAINNCNRGLEASNRSVEAITEAVNELKERVRGVETDVRNSYERCEAMSRACLGRIGRGE